MDLQTRKLNAIGYLINLQDEKIFSKIESAIIDSQKLDKRNLQPFTKKQLIDRANQSNKDYHSGSVKTQKQLEIESENW
ncbi:MAG: hypothetical protein NTZ69_16510 [Bacteroidia bacterium]|nr:hypothetical protein [Bacteroidia bacterium]